MTTDRQTACACHAKGGTCAPWCGVDPATLSLVGIRLNPPMAIARVGRSREPVHAYRWVADENPHRGVQTRIEPAPTLRPVSVSGDGHWPHRLTISHPRRVTFKDRHGRIRPVAPFFELWARMQRGDGSLLDMPVTPDLLHHLGVKLSDLVFTATAANRKAQSRTKLASCAAVARVTFAADSYRPHRLDAISPHLPDDIPLVRPDAPLPLGTIQTFVPNREHWSCATRLDQIRLRFTPGSGDCYGPPEATTGSASPRPPGDFEPAVTLYGGIYRMARPENRILSAGTPWSGFNFRDGGTPKWPTPQDSYDGSREGAGGNWGLIDDTCDLMIEAALTIGGRVLRARARAFAGPPDFAPDKRPMYSIRDEFEDRELPSPVPDRDSTPEEILDLFRRIFETASMVNLDQRRAWALAGNAAILGAPDPDAPDWDHGLSPRLGPKSMRADDTPLAETLPDYTPAIGDVRAAKGGAADRLPFTMVVQQVHARMADSPVLRDFLARRPERVRQIVRPPFARVADLPRRAGLTPPAAVPVGKWDRPPSQGGDVPERGDPPRFRDPRNVLDQTYDMRMPPFMRHSMGVPLSITRRQYALLMAWLDKLETDPDWRTDALRPDPKGTKDD